MFKPPSLLAIQVIPTATVFLLGSHGVFIRAEHVSLPPHAPNMLSVRNEQLTEGDFHPISLTALSATPTRCSALGASFRLGVRDALCCCRFPLVRPLPSVPSAAGCPALFEDFTGTTGLSDFPCSFIVGVRLWTSRRAPVLIPPGEYGISRFPCEVLPYVHGVFDREGPRHTSRYRCAGWCLPLLLTASASRSEFLTRLNTRPVRSPVNASSPPSRAAPHDSGSMWLAIPSSGDFAVTSPHRFSRRTRSRT